MPGYTANNYSKAHDSITPCINENMTSSHYIRAILRKRLTNETSPERKKEFEKNDKNGMHS